MFEYNLNTGKSSIKAVEDKLRGQRGVAHFRFIYKDGPKELGLDFAFPARDYSHYTYRFGTFKIQCFISSTRKETYDKIKIIESITGWNFTCDLCGQYLADLKCLNC